MNSILTYVDTPRGRGVPVPVASSVDLLAL